MHSSLKFTYGHVHHPQHQLLRIPSPDPTTDSSRFQLLNNNNNSSSSAMKRISSETSLAEVSHYEGYLYKRSKANPQKWLKRYFRWDGENLGYHTHPNDPAEAQVIYKYIFEKNKESYMAAKITIY